MLESPCRFSLIVTCYNFEDYLGKCLDSLRGQNYAPSHFEIVCVDDGSTDGSPLIMRAYQKRLTNLVPVQTPNLGLERACNLGIRRARFERIMRVDSDDMIAENFLSRMNQAIHQRPEFDFYYSKHYVEYYSESEFYQRELPDFDPEEIFQRGDFFATGTVYKKSDLSEAGFFSEGIKNCGLENYALILKLVAGQKRGLAVDGTSFHYRRHHSNMSSLKRGAIIEYGKELLSSYGRPFQTNQYHPYGLKLD